MFIGSFPFGGMLGSCRREGMCMLTLISEKGKGSLTLAMGKCLWFSVKIRVCQLSLSSP